MAFTGLLVLAELFNLRSLAECFKIKGGTLKVLYIYLQPKLIAKRYDANSRPPSDTGRSHGGNLDPISQFIDFLYSTSARTYQHVDIRLFLDFNKDLYDPSNALLKRSFSCVFLDSHLPQDDEQRIVQLFKNSDVHRLVPGSTDCVSPPQHEHELAGDVVQYRNVVLGGTFDRLHNGHKALLSHAILRCSHSLTVGVTDKEMIKGKILCDLIESCEKRITDVLEFARDVNPSLEYNVVPLHDIVGPAIGPELNAIIGSEEVIRGVEIVNQQRKQRGYKELDVVIIQLINDVHRNVCEEEKVSSSSRRMRLLGTLLKVPDIKPQIPASPRIIGLTGGIASGKSVICQTLEELFRVPVINCDSLGHKAYSPGTDCQRKVVEAFGDDILNPETGEIIRPLLGKKVFGNRAELDKLNRIVWPEISKLVLEKIEEVRVKGMPVVVIEAAILLESEMDKLCHEVWTCIASEKEVIERLGRRNGLSEEDARKRICSQMSTEERIQRSNVILSPIWLGEFTNQQVTRAWNLLQERLTSNRTDTIS